MAEDDRPMQPMCAGHTTSDHAADDLPALDPLTRTQLEETDTAHAPAERAGDASMPTLNPWLIVIFYIGIQLLLTPYWPSAGVHADAASNTAADGGSRYVHGQQYFRPLPPILNSSQAPGTIVSERMTEARRLELRQEAKQMFIDGYQAYLDHAFPLDELNPVACKGRGSDKSNDNNLNVNDVLGDFSLTLVDSLDTLAAIREPRLFQEAVQRVAQSVHFEVDSRVQVFEVNIRVLGALLSAHLYATDPRLNSTIPSYKGEMLDLATDLGKRLMKSFENTATGIPWPRVNLKKGVLRHERTETCAAGAGSLLLEFGVLSRLTGDPSFENAAKNALRQLWDRRTGLGLVGNTIDIQTGQWLSAMTGIGAGTDSFYEYLLKSYVLFGDSEYLEMYDSAAAAIQQHLLHETGYFYKHVHVTQGHMVANWVDSLSAFMPGVQVLAGDLESAIKNHLFYFNLWRKYQAIPERFSFVHQDTAIENYPLRPEFVESTYFLYRATKDPFYLQVGEMILRDLQRFAKTRCGWASLASVKSKQHEDRMESFALSETFKYLFLLFDEENVLHNDFKDTNFVFTTEGHILFLKNEYLDQKRLTVDPYRQPLSASSYQDQWNEMNQQWSVDSQFSMGVKTPSATSQRICMKPKLPKTFLKGTTYRPDFDFARQLVGVAPDVRDIVELDPEGYCDKPRLEQEQVVVEFSGPPSNTFFETEEDEDEGIREAREYHRRMQGRAAPPVKILDLKGIQSDKGYEGTIKGVYIDRLIGVQLRLTYDSALKGYRADMVDGRSVHPLEPVYVDLTAMQPLYDSFQRQQAAHLRVIRPLWRPGENDKGYGDEDKGGDEAKEVEVEEFNVMVTPATFGAWHPFLDTYEPTEVKRHVVIDKPSSSLVSSAKTSTHSVSDTSFGHDHQFVQQSKEAAAAADSTNEGDEKEHNGSGGQVESKKALKQKHRPTLSRLTYEMVRIHANPHGCRPYSVQEQEQVRDKIVVVDRGACLFILKAYYAQVAGASSIVVINNNDQHFQMTGNIGGTTAPAGQQNQEQQQHAGMVIGDNLKDDDISIPAVMVGRQQGLQLLHWIEQDQSSKHTTQDSKGNASGENQKDEDGSSSSPLSLKNKSMPHASDTQRQRLQQQRHRRGIEAQLVQQKLAKETLRNARLTYNEHPILNIQTLEKYRRLS
ncbi:alpha mannosidase-like protein [Actinomortierella wolfii]|nr:alpha mannosidase-like protein [Actinomortierella wolfii]